MTRDEALAFHRELKELVPLGPGNALVNAEPRLARIRAAFDGDPDVGVYLGGRVAEACEFLGVWLGPRLRGWESDVTGLRAVVDNCINGMGRAIDTQFPGSAAHTK